MAEIITISNELLSVSISTMGAEIVSAVKNGREYIWQADPSVWAKHSPVLFPICGGLNNDKYTYEGKEYTLTRHGFAKTSLFDVEYKDSEKVVFLLKSNDETRENYPFEFEFRMIYTLEKDTLKVEYNVRNTDSKTLYFAFGGHDAYNCPEGVDDYSLIFEKEEDLDSTLLVGPVLGHEIMNFGKATKELKLKKEFFELDTLVFLNLNSKKVWLQNNNTGERLGISFKDFDYFMVWTKVGAKFLCLEPWCGLSDYFDAGSDITQKAGMMTLEPTEVCNKKRYVTF